MLNGLHSIALWWFDNKAVGKEALVDVVANLLWNGLSALEAARRQTGDDWICRNAAARLMRSVDGATAERTLVRYPKRRFRPLGLALTYHWRRQRTLPA